MIFLKGMDMDESEFEQLAAQELLRIESALERCDADIDYARRGDSVLEISCDHDGSQIVVNIHRAMQEVWVAARSGGYHFRWQQGQWFSGREGSELYALLSSALSEQCRQPVVLKPL